MCGKQELLPSSQSKELPEASTRQEFEYAIPLSDAEALMKLCRPLIEKTRYVLEYRGKRWEVDEFHGDNDGLVLPRR